MVGDTEVIQDGHRADQYPEVGFWEAISTLGIDSGRITGYTEVTRQNPFSG
jgi:hypothetical protein